MPGGSSDKTIMEGYLDGKIDVFQAGPSKTMYGTSGTGSQKTASLRGSDTDSMNGNAAMYDAVNGKIFAAGGSPSYQSSNGTNNVHLITIGSPRTTPAATTFTSMTCKRAFVNRVVLPNGKIFITGGRSYAVPFTDSTVILTPELFDPVVQTFQVSLHTLFLEYTTAWQSRYLTEESSPGKEDFAGLFAANQEDMQIYSLAYLLNSDETLTTHLTITSAIPTVFPPLGGEGDNYRRYKYCCIQLLAHKVWLRDTHC
jgi:galactose oxidase